MRSIAGNILEMVTVENRHSFEAKIAVRLRVFPES
jgi:hypothetical protein